MKIAVLSGKGGTGKTLLSVNLSAVLSDFVSAGEGPLTNNSYIESSVTYIDCDVEEPNGRLFLKPDNIIEENVSVLIPSVNNSLCTGCRKCVSFCKFNALALIKDKVMVFEEVCHSCGGCKLFCPEQAISEKQRVVGKIEKGISHVSEKGKVNVLTGVLNTGEVSGVPIIRKLLENGQKFENDQAGLSSQFCKNRERSQCAPNVNDVQGTKCVQSVLGAENFLMKNHLIIDCPPGCACVVMESIKDADYCILVAEPTIFGVHNLEMVYELVKMFGKKFGVALNKTLTGDNPAENFCIKRGIKILGSIPFDRDLGLLNSSGEIVAMKNEKFKKLFEGILQNVFSELGGCL